MLPDTADRVFVCEENTVFFGYDKISQKYWIAVNIGSSEIQQPGNIVKGTEDMMSAFLFVHLCAEIRKLFRGCFSCIACFPYINGIVGE